MNHLNNGCNWNASANNNLNIIHIHGQRDNGASFDSLTSLTTSFLLVYKIKVMQLNKEEIINEMDTDIENKNINNINSATDDPNETPCACVGAYVIPSVSNSKSVRFATTNDDKEKVVEVAVGESDHKNMGLSTTNIFNYNLNNNNHNEMDMGFAKMYHNDDGKVVLIAGVQLLGIIVVGARILFVMCDDCFECDQEENTSNDSATCTSVKSW